MFAPSTRVAAIGCLSGTTGNKCANVNQRPRRSLRARTADDASALGIDVDPNHSAVLNEFEAVGAAIEFRPEIVGTTHERQNPALELRKRHRTPLARRLEGPLRFARRVGQRGGAGQAGRNRGGEEEGTEHSHYATLF
jgi:hypothetical protein